MSLTMNKGKTMEKSPHECLIAGEPAARADPIAYKPAANIDSPAVNDSITDSPTANTNTTAADDIHDDDQIIANSSAPDSPSVVDPVTVSTVGDKAAAVDTISDSPVDEECASYNPSDADVDVSAGPTNADVEGNGPCNDDDDDPAVFPLTILPEEVQDLILIDIAVGWRLATNSYEKVYTSLAPVCKRWQAVLKKPKFFDEVKARFLKLDGTARYRRHSQRIQVEGIEKYQAGIEGAVILDKKLYLIESYELTTPILPRYNIFVYNLDFSDYNHTEETKRRVICSDRRELIIEGPHNRPVMLVSSPAKNCLYFLARGSNVERMDDFRKHVYRVRPNGAVDYFLNARGFVQNMSVDKSGEHLVINNRGQISIYSTRTLQITSSLKLDFFKNPPSTDEFVKKPYAEALRFLSAVLRDDLTLMTCILETLSTVYVVLWRPTADGKSYQKSIERYYRNEYEVSLEADDNLCTILLGNHLHVSGRLLERARKMDCYFEPGMSRFLSGYAYDRRYGLVMGVYHGKLTMVRVTI